MKRAGGEPYEESGSPMEKGDRERSAVVRVLGERAVHIPPRLHRQGVSRVRAV
jgi:hypothetical protein